MTPRASSTVPGDAAIAAQRLLTRKSEANYGVEVIGAGKLTEARTAGARGDQAKRKKTARA